MRLDAYFSQPLSDVFDRNGQETEGLDLGTLDVTSGRRAVGDNTFFPQDQLEMDSQPGRYSVQANIRDWGTDRRGSRLRAAAKSKNTYLAAFYHRVAARRGKKRAVVAVAHKLLRIAYHVIQHNCPYHELGADFFDNRDRDFTARRLTQRLEKLGFAVSLNDVAA